MDDWVDGWGGHSGLAPHVEREVVPASGGGGEKKRMSWRAASIQ